MRHDPLSITAVYEHVGGEVPTSYREYIKVRCIFHDDRNPSATINEDSGRFHCWVCDISLDGFGLLMQFYSTDFRGALDIARRLDPRHAETGAIGGGNGLLRKANARSRGALPDGSRNTSGGRAWRPPWLRSGSDAGA